MLRLYQLVWKLQVHFNARLARLSIFASMLSTIAFVGVTTKTGEYSLIRSKQQQEITVDFPVPGGPFIGIVPSPFILSLAARCS